MESSFFLLQFLTTILPCWYMLQTVETHEDRISFHFMHLESAHHEEVHIECSPNFFLYRFDDFSHTFTPPFLYYLYFLMEKARSQYRWMDEIMGLMSTLRVPRQVPPLTYQAKMAIDQWDSQKYSDEVIDSVRFFPPFFSHLRRVYSSCHSLVVDGAIPSHLHLQAYLSRHPVNIRFPHGCQIDRSHGYPLHLFQGPTLYDLNYYLHCHASDTKRDLPYLLAVEAILDESHTWYRFHHTDYLAQIEQYYVLIIHAKNSSRRRLFILSPNTLQHAMDPSYHSPSPFTLHTGCHDFLLFEIHLKATLLEERFVERRVHTVFSLESLATEQLFTLFMHKKLQFTLAMYDSKHSEILERFGTFLAEIEKEIGQWTISYIHARTSRVKIELISDSTLFPSGLLKSLQRQLTHLPCPVYFFPLMVSPSRHHMISPTLRQDLIHLYGL